jgi:hypothetical protein
MRLLDPNEHATDQPVELNLGDALLHFVNEQMRLLNMRSVNAYISKLVDEEKARAALQEDVRRKQAEVRRLSALRRQSRSP